MCKICTQITAYWQNIKNLHVILVIVWASKELTPNCSVLVGSRNRFAFD